MNGQAENSMDQQTGSDRPQCQAETQAGARCKNTGQVFRINHAGDVLYTCYVHSRGRVRLYRDKRTESDRTV